MICAEIACARFCASIGSRSAGETSSQLTALASKPFALASTGNSTRLESPVGAAMVLPTRSAGLAMPEPFSVMIDIGAIS